MKIKKIIVKNKCFELALPDKSEMINVVFYEPQEHNENKKDNKENKK